MSKIAHLIEDPVWRNEARDLATLRAKTVLPRSAGQMDGPSARFRECDLILEGKTAS